MKEKQIDFGNEKVAVVFRKLFFPTLLGMLSLSAVTTIDGIFVGHGVGAKLHEEPSVPNFGEPGRGIKLSEGMTIAIEPMVNVGTPDVTILDDEWTTVTNDGKLSAHFEHTIAITNEGVIILTGDDV